MISGNLPVAEPVVAVNYQPDDSFVNETYANTLLKHGVNNLNQ